MQDIRQRIEERQSRTDSICNPLGLLIYLKIRGHWDIYTSNPIKKPLIARLGACHKPWDTWDIGTSKTRKRTTHTIVMISVGGYGMTSKQDPEAMTS